MLGNNYATMTLQVKSNDSNGKSMSRTIAATALNQAALQDNQQAFTINVVDTNVRALYALSANSYADSFIIGKVDVTEVIVDG